MSAQEFDVPDSHDDREIVVRRTFTAPRNVVWAAMTDPQWIQEWWGPEGFSTTVDEMDLCIGGRWRYVMRGPDGAEYPVEGIFVEIVEPERLVTSDEFGEDYENPSPAELPQGVVVAVYLEDLGAETNMTLRMVHRSSEDRANHEQMGVEGGWHSSFNRLDRYLAGLTLNG